jgi:hypothetical protein
MTHFASHFGWTFVRHHYCSLTHSNQTQSDLAGHQARMNTKSL